MGGGSARQGGKLRGAYGVTLVGSALAEAFGNSLRSVPAFLPGRASVGAPLLQHCSASHPFVPAQLGEEIRKGSRAPRLGDALSAKSRTPTQTCHPEWAE